MSKCYWKNGADRLAQRMAATHLHFVKNAVSAKCNKIRYAYTSGWSFPGGSVGKESACHAGDICLIPWLGSSPGEGIGYPLQYSCLENPMDRGAWDYRLGLQAGITAWDYSLGLP